MSSEQEIKATVWVEGEASMWRYYVPNADKDETRERLREAEFCEIDEPRAQFLLQIKATVRIEREVSMSVEGDPGGIPLVDIDPIHYYVPNADMDETKERLLKAEFLLHPRSAVAALNDELRAAEGHIRGCQGAGCGATCVCPCHAGTLRG